MVLIQKLNLSYHIPMDPVLTAGKWFKGTAESMHIWTSQERLIHLEIDAKLPKYSFPSELKLFGLGIWGMWENNFF